MFQIHSAYQQWSHYYSTTVLLGNFTTDYIRGRMPLYLPVYQRGAILYTLLLLPTGSESKAGTPTQRRIYLEIEKHSKTSPIHLLLFHLLSSQKRLVTIWVRLEHTVRITAEDLNGRHKTRQNRGYKSLYMCGLICVLFFLTQELGSKVGQTTPTIRNHPHDTSQIIWKPTHKIRLTFST